MVNRLKPALLASCAAFGITVAVSAAVAQDNPRSRPNAATQVDHPASVGRDSLLAGFRTPPQVARPQVWWHLMNGNVAKEGMALDLDWLARTGIGGVHAFSGALFEPTVVPHPLPFMSDGWRDAFRFAVARARTLGMEVTIAGSPGWSETGGPWVTPDQAMKKYVWSETEVTGGRRVRRMLTPLPDATGSIQQAPSVKPSKLRVIPIAHGAGPVVAFRSREPDDAAPPTYTLDGAPMQGLADAPADLSKTVKVALGADGTTIKVDYPRRVTLQGLTIAMDTQVPFDVEASVDGRTFRRIGSYAVVEGEAPSPQQTVTFAPVPARAMRVVLRQAAPRHTLPGVPPSPRPTSTVLRLLRFRATPTIARFESKAGFEPTAAPGAAMTAPATGAIDPAGVIDLSTRVSPGGVLDWTPPPGRWTIVRYGWSLTGQANAPAEPEATGLEVDKLDASAVRRYIDDYLARYQNEVGVQFGANGIRGLLTDSWEAGVQNWTPTMLADFRRLRGYDPTPWLPTLAGHVVRDAAASDAFLADYRQTLKDLVVTNHYAVLRDAAHQRDMSYYTEVQGDLPRAISDGLTAKGEADIPTAEYWFQSFTTDPGQPPLLADLKEASSAAHLYGHALAAAESLTMAALADPWSTAPNVLKPAIDRIFAQGINRILIHDSHHQPFADKKPGLQLAIFGQWFNRNETWADQARPWSDYLARTSYLLQQGRFVADVGFLYGEQRALTEIYNHAFNDAVPPGYGYDYIDAASLKSPLSIANGTVTTGSGMRYRVLYLSPEAGPITLEYASRLRDLVLQGAVLVGPPPSGKLGLSGSEADFSAIVKTLWPSDAPADHQLGKGRVLRTADLGAALETLGVSPDVAVPRDARLLTLHRQTADADIFFVANQDDAPFERSVRFRVSGRVPQWWSPETGRTSPLAFRGDDKGVTVQLHLTPGEAGFVVFHPGTETVAAEQPITTISADTIEGKWNVAFQPGRGAPEKTTFASLHDWSTDPAPGVRYYSGVATYTRTIRVPRRAGTQGRLYLDLGQVHEIATVSLNGKEIGTAWHAPYRIDITDFARSGDNRLEIKVANLWVNRLIGDKQPGATAVAYAPQSTYRAASKLLPSGLVGPVRLVRQTGQTFAF